jgi:hypothetical protein
MVALLFRHVALKFFPGANQWPGSLDFRGAQFSEDAIYVIARFAG